MPNDPAIMQMQLSNQMGQQNGFQPQFSMPVVGHVGNQMGPFPNQGNAGPFSAMAGLGGMPGGVPNIPGPFGANQQAQQQNKAKHSSELIRGYPDTTSPSADEQINQGDTMNAHLKRSKRNLFSPII